MDRQAALKQRIHQRIHKPASRLAVNENTVSTKGFWGEVMLFLPLIYAAVYVIGLFYHIGYLDSFQLNPYDFQQPTDLTLLRGVFSLISMSTPFMLPILLIFLAFVLLLLFLLFARQTRRKMTAISCWFKRLFSSNHELQNSMAEAKATNQLLDKSFSIYSLFFTFILSLMFLVFLGVASMQSGIADAKKDKERLYLPNTTQTEIISPLLAKGPYIRIVCNSSHCAYWNKQGTLVLRHDQIEKTLFPPE